MNRKLGRVKVLCGEVRGYLKVVLVRSASVPRVVPTHVLSITD